MPRIKSTPENRAVILAYLLAPRANEPAPPTGTAIACESTENSTDDETRTVKVRVDPARLSSYSKE